jgi:hypothetical protein
MEDRIAWLESRVATLAGRVTVLEKRLTAIEGATPAPALSSLAAAEETRVPPVVGLGNTPLPQVLGLAGRTLVVLGGAYLLRALTESQMLPPVGGVALGLLYGAPWLMLASRAAARGAELDAIAHAVTSALIGYPLVWEATLRFGVLNAAQSAAVLGLLTAMALLLSWTRRLHGLAWVVALGTLISALGLAIGSGDWIPYTVLAIVVGVATLWLGYSRDWTLLRWPAAGFADLLLLVLAGRTAENGQIVDVLVVQLLMLLGYLGSFAIRTLLIGRPVIAFEIAQSIAALAVAYGGAIALISSNGSNIVIVGLASVGLALVAYVVAFAFVDRRRAATNFFFYAQLAQLFAIVGVLLCASGTVASIAYSVLAVGMAELARRKQRRVLLLQAAVYSIAATMISGLAARAALPLTGTATIDVNTALLAQLVALAVLGAITGLRVTNHANPVFDSVLRVVLIVVFVWTAAGTAIALAVALAPGGEHIGPSGLATIRTAALVIATLALATAARLPSGREAGWLVYPMLFLTGAKLMISDFPSGRPQTLFVALALYGIALIATPRLVRKPLPAARPIAEFRSLPTESAATAATAVAARVPK